MYDISYTADLWGFFFFFFSSSFMLKICCIIYVTCVSYISLGIKESKKHQKKGLNREVGCEV